PLLPYTTLFRSDREDRAEPEQREPAGADERQNARSPRQARLLRGLIVVCLRKQVVRAVGRGADRHFLRLRGLRLSGEERRGELVLRNVEGQLVARPQITRRSRPSVDRQGRALRRRKRQRIAFLECDRDAVAAVGYAAHFSFEADVIAAGTFHDLPARRRDVGISLERLVGPRHIL